MKVDLDRLAPEERRIVLVASDDTYRRLTARVDWASVARLAFGRLLSVTAPITTMFPLVAPVLGEALARSGYLTPTFARVASELGPLRTRALRVGEIPIPHLSPREASQRFRFDHGMPEDGAAYVLNPVRADHYVRPALINERLAQEKLAAFLRLASALGAAEVLVTSGDVVDRGASAIASSPLPEAAGQIGLDVKLQQGGQVDRAIVARFDRSDAPPRVPDELRPWLAIDPVLEGIAQNRLEARLREIAFTLSFSDVVDLGARACLELEGKGIDVGGRYHSLKASRWSFQIRFFD